MKCHVCKRNIAAGAEAQKMIVEYRQDDGSTLIFGYLMQAGPKAAATGQLVRGWHHKCYHIVRKREARGEGAEGRPQTGPYVHTHQVRLDIYHLREHLDRAHGISADEIGSSSRSLHQWHDELHALSALAATQAERQADPGHAETHERDWRTQVAVNVEELT